MPGRKGSTISSRGLRRCSDRIADRTEEQQGRWLLAIFWTGTGGRRKRSGGSISGWRILSADELLDEKAGIAGLEFIVQQVERKERPVHRYSFLLQETELRGGEQLHSVGGKKFGTVETVSLEER